MKLIIDIGNSRSKIGIFEKNELLEVITFPVLETKYLDEVKQKYPQITHALFSATGGYAEEIKTKLEKDFQLVVMNPALKFPVNNLYKTPHSLGTDRLAGVVGADFLFPKQNTIVVDAGTCITIDFIDDKSNYHGGAILPGISIKFNALHTFTKNLPLLENKNNFQPPITGQNTNDSIYSGVLNGTLFEVAGFIDTYKSKYNSTNVIFTGGDYAYFVENLEIKKFAEPNLVLKGLNVILDINAAK